MAKTSITEELFKEIKDRLNAGMSINKAKVEFRRGSNTVTLIRNSESFAEYREKANVMNEEHAREYYTPVAKGARKKSNKYYNPLTEEEFNTIKELLFQGHRSVEIRELTGRAHQTILSVKMSPSFNEYKFVDSKKKRYPVNPIIPMHSGTLSQRISEAVEKILREELEQNLNDYHKGFMEKLTKGNDK